MKRSNIMLGGLLSFVIVLFLMGYSIVLTIAVQETSTNIFDSSSKPQLLEVGDKTSGSIAEVLSLTDIFERSEKGVVSITVQKSLSFTGQNRVGSGFVYDKKGNIITNNHVIGNADKIIVTFIDGTSYNAEIIGVDPFSDLAVIKIDVSPEILHPLPIGSSSDIKVGEPVAAIGNPFGLSGSMSSGIISQIGRLLPAQGTGFSIPDVIQTDAAINPGNSGGPLLNMKGEVIGINTAILSNGGDFSGVGFAVPSKTAMKIVPFLIRDGEYKHPWIGITSQNIDPDLAEILSLKEAKGILVMTVVKDSPADKAGLNGSSQTVEKDGIKRTVGGDIVLSIDDREVRKIDDILTHLQREKNLGDKITLNVLRDGKEITVDVTLGERPTR